MKSDKIKLGFELGTGKEIDIQPSHLIVTGLTQKAGKTTTLESLIQRSGKKAIVFRTKIGEKSFLSGTIIPPFFTDRSDWQFIESLIESTMKEKVQRMERANIIKLSKQTNGKSLTEFKKKVDQRLTEKISSFESMILTNLQAYLEIVIPKLNTIQFSKTLELADGLNIIDLERFSRDSEVQSLIIRSVLEEVLYKYQDVIIVIPEAWKFIPQERELFIEDRKTTFGEGFRRYEIDKPCFTLLTDCRAWLNSGNGARKFTNEECALIQGFPKSYKFYGNKTSVRKQIGNAVPSPIIKVFFEQITIPLPLSERVAE